MSSQRYQEFIAERTRLLERIKELEAENAELRKRLGEGVTHLCKGARTRERLTVERCGRKLLTMPKPEIEG